MGDMHRCQPDILPVKAMRKHRVIPRMNTSSRPQKKYGVWPGLLRIFRQTVMLGKRVRAMRQVHRAVRQVHP